MVPYVCGFKCSFLYTFHRDAVFIDLRFTLQFLTLIFLPNVINTFNLFLLSSQTLIIYVIYIDEKSKKVENVHNVYAFQYNAKNLKSTKKESVLPCRNCTYSYAWPFALFGDHFVYANL